MKPATETQQTPAVEYCEDHHAPICAKCGYCTEDPEHQKHTQAAEPQHHKFKRGIVLADRCDLCGEPESPLHTTPAAGHSPLPWITGDEVRGPKDSHIVYCNAFDTAHPSIVATCNKPSDARIIKQAVNERESLERSIVSLQNQLSDAVIAGQGLQAEREELVVALREMLEIVQDEGHAMNYVPQVTTARAVLERVGGEG